MIKVTMELCPGGLDRPELNETLGVIYIANQIVRTASSRGVRGDYLFKLHKKRKGRVVYEGVIEDFPRLSYHPWNLVKRILDSCASQNGGTI